ncbi:GHMP kinase [Nocardiopsis sp. HNM0947]|uniref:GHMP kinase n=1 Tax=Nocardiopsis coralli TaxID=2772213 RepID=A0ABR9P5W7_9ACTN|nr:galactokinase family protein [Nocardiopsis coralli]MBE2999243.1 GHMP kinase [Nocardiopsis coralli]
MGGAGTRLRAALGLGPAGPRGAWPRNPPDPDALAQAFTERFGVPPAGVWHAPGRLALMGEHTAVSEGAGLYAALPWGVRVALGPTEDAQVHAATPEGPLRARSAIAAEISAAVDRARRDAVLAPGAGVRAVVAADLPDHASLGYTSALRAATALALADLGGAPPPEGADAGERVALVARPGCAVRVNHKSLRTTVLPFDLAAEDLHLLVADTGSRHRRDLRRAREDELRRAAGILGPLRAVQDLPAALNRMPNAAMARRVEYAVTEVHRLNAAVGLLRADRFGEVGPILSASHLSLRRFELPTADVDLAAESASRAGARGVRMSGWHGTAFALVGDDRLERVLTGVERAFAGRGDRAPHLRTARPAAGAHRLR